VGVRVGVRVGVGSACLSCIASLISISHALKFPADNNNNNNDNSSNDNNDISK
jgi:hypothetical protein